MPDDKQAEIQKCIIIGSGPAGYTAGIYAARANLKPVLFQGKEPGGQLMLTTDVENYPGYPDGVQGPEMMQEFQKQAERMDTDVRMGMVTKVDFSGPPHKVVVDDKEEWQAHAVIISTGAVAKWLGLESEERLNGKGVSACAVCDGFFAKGQEVAVVGGGDTACEESLYLANLCPKVHVLVRRDEMRASKVMQDRVKNHKNIQMHWNTEAEEILGQDEVEGVKVKTKQNGTVKNFDIPVKGFFVAIGHTPNTGIFKDFIDMDAQGYIKTARNSTKTNVEGVFASGDVQDKMFRQAVTAAGTGCMAAMEAERYLGEKGIE